MWAGPIMQSIVMLDSFDKRRREYKRLGWVYVARNPCCVFRRSRPPIPGEAVRLFRAKASTDSEPRRPG